MRSKTIFLTVGNAVLHFLRIWNQVRAYSVSSLHFVLFVEFIFVLCRISWDKTLPMSPLTNYSKLMRLYSCTEGEEELAHMQYRKGLHKQYRHKVETHPVSKIGPLSAQSAQFYCLLGASLTHQAPSPARWLRNHVWRIPLRIPKLCGFGRMSTRGLYM